MENNTNNEYILEVLKNTSTIDEAFAFIKKELEIKFIERKVNLDNEIKRFTYIQITLKNNKHRHYLHQISPELYDRFQSKFEHISKTKRNYIHRNHEEDSDEITAKIMADVEKGEQPAEPIINNSLNK